MTKIEISWSAKIGKKAFFARIRKPKNIFSIVIGSIMAIFLIADLIFQIEEDFNLEVPGIYSIFIILLIIFTIAIYIIKQGIMVEDKVLHYTLDNEKVTVNKHVHAWKEYQYFRDEYKFRNRTAPSILRDTNPDVYIISLAKKRFSDKGKLVLMMENRDTYEKVSKIVKTKLKDGLNAN